MANKTIRCEAIVAGYKKGYRYKSKKIDVIEVYLLSVEISKI